MIDYFLENKSNRTFCQRCQQFIIDKMQGVEEVSNFGNKEYRYFCINCSGKIIQEAKQELHNIENSLKFQARKLGVEE